ncbi:MAG: hypothetical protein H6938_03945 [Burkholderiales bacterium]|nr:hypothetical protein [Burkholderiales bacterium]
MDDEKPPKFCSTCGVLLKPPNYIHVERTCKQCGETIYVSEPGENGKGIKVNKGEKLTFPAGSISLSLKPTGGNHLFKPGVSWLVQTFMLEGAPQTYRDMESLFDKYDEIAETKLKKSEKLTGLSLESEKDSKKIHKTLEKDKSSWEWWAYLTGVYSAIGRDAIKGGEIDKASYACFMAGKCHSMLVFIEELEYLVWKGYLAEKVVYNAATAAVNSPAEVEAIEKLHPLFEELSDAALYAWVNSDEDIGPKIGFKDLSEPVIKALTQFHMASRERKKEEERSNKELQRSIRDMRVRWFGIGVAALGGLMAAMKTLEWL